MTYEDAMAAVLALVLRLAGLAIDVAGFALRVLVRLAIVGLLGLLTLQVWLVGMLVPRLVAATGIHVKPNNALALVMVTVLTYVAAFGSTYVIILAITHVTTVWYLLTIGAAAGSIMATLGALRTNRSAPDGLADLSFWS